MKRTPMKRKSDSATEKLADAEALHADGHGLLPHEAMEWIELYLATIRQWPRPRRLTDPRVIVRLQKSFGFCFVCERQCDWTARGESWLKLDPHHLTGGTAGRADELCNLMPLCRKCHDKFQSLKPAFGFLLYRKWKFDRPNTDWLRLTILHGQCLPELITEWNPE